jgi:hypothetical protein
VVSNGITFTPNFMKMGQLVLKVKGNTHRQRGDLISLILVPYERKVD